MRLIDADEFDRRLAAAEFNAALNNADDESRPFREQTMYYSTQSFRDVMSCRPTVDAIPVEWLKDAAGRYEYSGCNDSADVVMEVIKDWYKEQGAKQ